ncbi:MAG: TIGR02186 family protein [Pseudomonadota bacterium]
MKYVTLLLAFIAFSLQAGFSAAEDNLITQLDSDHVDITAHFTGEQILVFGAIANKGDVIIKVTSPAQDVAMSQKVRSGPIWLDSGHISVKNTPGIMYLLSSHPINQIVAPQALTKYGLNLQSGLSSSVLEGSTQGMEDWQTAFLRLKQSKKYYKEFDNAVTVVGDRLFFAKLTLPAKLPLGEYALDTYLVRDGKVTAHQSSKLEVRQVQSELWVSNFAHQNPWLYGVSFTLLAIFIGLALGILLRRNSNKDG